MAERDISIILRARDEASRVVQGFASQLTSLKGVVAGLGLAFGAQQLVQAFVSGIKSSIAAALEAEEAQARLRAAIERTGASWDLLGPAIQHQLTRLQETTRFSDEEASAALQRLTTITGSYGRAMQALGPTLDLAAAMHMDVESAARVLAVALEGNTAMLSRYGIVLDDTTKEALKTADAQERLNIILAAFTEKVGGAAVRDVESVSGAYKLLTNQVSELQETLGGLILSGTEAGGMIGRMGQALGDLNLVLGASREELDVWIEVIRGLAVTPQMQLVLKFFDMLAAGLHDAAEEIRERQGWEDFGRGMLATAEGAASAATRIEELTARAKELGVELQSTAEAKLLDKMRLVRDLAAAGEQPVGGLTAALAALQDQLRKVRGEAEPIDWAAILGDVERQAKSFEGRPVTIHARIALESELPEMAEAISAAFGGPTAAAIEGALATEQWAIWMGAAASEAKVLTEARTALDAALADGNLTVEEAAALTRDLAAAGLEWDEVMASQPQAVQDQIRAVLEMNDAYAQAITQLERYAAVQQAVSSVAAAASAAGINAAGKSAKAHFAIETAMAVLQALIEKARGASALAVPGRQAEAALHFLAAALWAVAAAQKFVAFARAQAGGIVAGTGIGDRQPFLLEAGEAILPRQTAQLIFGGRAALVPAESANAAAGEREVMVSADRTVSIANTFQLGGGALAAPDIEALLGDLNRLVEQRGFRLTASRLVAEGP